jgi:hypothetical protein
MTLHRFQIAQRIAEEVVDARPISAPVLRLIADRGRVLGWLARLFGQSGLFSDGTRKQTVSDCRNGVSGFARKRGSK